MGQVFWQGIWPWLVAAVGCGFAAFLPWLSVGTRYKGMVAAQTVKAADMTEAEQQAKLKLEALGNFEPQFALFLWHASVQPVFLFILLFVTGKHLSTDSPQHLWGILLAIAAFVVLLLHEFRWKEVLPGSGTRTRVALVAALWIAALIVAIWVASTPFQPETPTPGARPAPSGAAG